MHRETKAVVYVVATPIGNLDDLTPRARKTLESVDVIAAEDTRNTRKLLSHLGITAKHLISYQDHGEEERAAVILERLIADGTSLALVSDAGTPCVSDPGYRLVKKARELGVPVHPIPGVSALTTLVSASGLASDRFTFVGFLPSRAKALADEVRSWADLGGAVVFFEAARRLSQSLPVIAAAYPNARIAIGRELTKLFEEIVTVGIQEALVWTEAHATLKGEVTAMLSIPRLAVEAAVDTDALAERARQAFARGATLKDLLLQFKDEGLKRAELYQLLLSAKP
jgi:16S rRNA (cytidine1402-2'-O)-methyltransferase